MIITDKMLNLACYCPRGFPDFHVKVMRKFNIANLAPHPGLSWSEIHMSWIVQIPVCV